MDSRPVGEIAIAMELTRNGDLSRRRLFGLLGAGTAALAAIPSLGMLAGCPTDWIVTVEKDAPIVVSIAETIVSIVASLTGNGAITPAALAIIDEAAKIFSAATATLKDAIDAYNAAKGPDTLSKVIEALNQVELDAPKVILAVVQLPSGLISIITAAIGTAISLLSAIQSLIPQSVVTGNAVAVAPAKRVAVVGVKLPDAQVLKSNFNATLSVYGYGQFAVK